MQIISKRTVELTEREAKAKGMFDGLLSGGWTQQQAITRVKDLHMGLDPAFFRWLADETLVPDNPRLANYPYDWAVARLKDSREAGEIDKDVSDEVIEREAFKLEELIFQTASSFIDNDFNEKEDK